MSEWGDDPLDGDPFEVDDEPETTSGERAEPGRAFGVDIAQVAGDLVAASFQKAIRQRVAAVVSETVEAEVEQVLDDEVLEDLGRRAQTAAAEAVERELAALAAADDEDEEPAPALYFGSVDEFVREYLIKAYRRRIDGSRWLWPARWWEYDEAVIRLEALWRSWEMLRQDPSTGMSVWWRDHADHHMAVLLSSDGPFAGYEVEEGRNEAGEPLPYERPPADLFPDVRVPAEDASQTT